MTKVKAFEEINSTQDYYVNELLQTIYSTETDMMKTINFNSPTGTGKTKMMSKLMNLLSDCYFIITTLSKGQLNRQIEENLRKDCNQNNYTVYGSSDYRINSKLQAEDILSRIPLNTKCIWLRDEGHIKTNRYEDLLLNKCYKVINFSATNKELQGINCNFTHTMMLRSVNQTTGTPEDAIKKLLEVKKQHKIVVNYNPCAIFRCVSGDTILYNNIVSLCKKYKLKYIDITEETYNMYELCKDDNEYDVLINKFKIVEGIDIRRSHVLYMDNQPNNNATTIQVIGRCRRNALLYRNDIDIFAPENEQLLKDTRECYVFYNVKQMRIDEDENGELQSAFCKYISCEALKTDINVDVVNGQLSNGLCVIELEGQTGSFNIGIDKDTGFNIIEPLSNFYNTDIETVILPKWIKIKYFDWSTGKSRYKNISPYSLKPWVLLANRYEKVIDGFPNNMKVLFNKLKGKYTKEYIIKRNKEKFGDKYGNHYKNPMIIEKVKSSCSGIQYFKHLNVITLYKGSEQGVTLKEIEESIYDYFESLDFFIDTHYIIGVTEVLNDLLLNLSTAEKELKRNVVNLFYSFVYRKKGQRYSIEHSRILRFYEEEGINISNDIKIIKRINNDRESSIIGVDLMRQSKNEHGEIRWVENKAISAKIDNYNKFNRFISKKYEEELNQGISQCFTGKNDFNLDKKCNSVLGYCVEYYSKYLVYGDGYLDDYIQTAQKESKTQTVNDCIIVRACMLKYRDMMVNCFGKGVEKVIKTISVTSLVQEKYRYFVNLVVKLGTRTANFINNYLYSNQEAVDNIDTNLSIKHISGLADYITKDTILDVKVRNNIDIICIKQVLGYHYLSTKRSDLNIKKVIIYDATSGKFVIIHITNKNIGINGFNADDIIDCNTMLASEFKICKFTPSQEEIEEAKLKLKMYGMKI